MTWNLLPVIALLVVSGLYLVRRALKTPQTQPEAPRAHIAPARTMGERAWRDQPLQTFMWQLQAARHSEPPFRRR